MAIPSPSIAYSASIRSTKSGGGLQIEPIRRPFGLQAKDIVCGIQNRTTSLSFPLVDASLTMAVSRLHTRSSAGQGDRMARRAGSTGSVARGNVSNAVSCDTLDVTCARQES